VSKSMFKFLYSLLSFVIARKALAEGHSS
jgi:hypothetical protein